MILNLECSLEAIVDNNRASVGAGLLFIFVSVSCVVIGILFTVVGLAARGVAAGHRYVGILNVRC